MSTTYLSAMLGIQIIDDVIDDEPPPRTWAEAEDWNRRLSLASELIAAGRDEPGRPRGEEIDRAVRTWGR